LHHRCRPSITCGFLMHTSMRSNDSDHRGDPGRIREGIVSREMDVGPQTLSKFTGGCSWNEGSRTMPFCSETVGAGELDSGDHPLSFRASKHLFCLDTVQLVHARTTERLRRRGSDSGMVPARQLLVMSSITVTLTDASTMPPSSW
jgi:hypothetical protein